MTGERTLPTGARIRASAAKVESMGQTESVAAQNAPLASPTFSVARNPDPGSKLPYLIRLPLQGGALVLKAAEVWPRTAKVYCHRVEEWPARPT